MNVAKFCCLLGKKSVLELHFHKISLKEKQVILIFQGSSVFLLGCELSCYTHCPNYSNFFLVKKKIKHIHIHTHTNIVLKGEGN